MKRAGFSRCLARDRRGGVTMILAGSLFMLAGAATVAVDLGSVFLAKRQLQGIADAAALAAGQEGRTGAEALVTKTGVGNIRFVSFELGYYAADATVAVENRFLPGDARNTAARLELERHVPLFFGRLLVGRDGIDIRARATAARTDMASFSIGTGLASVSDGLSNMILSSLVGTELNLSVMDSQGLANLNVDLLGFADALKVRLGKDGVAYGELFDQNIPLSDIVGAIAASAAASPATTTLSGLVGKMPGRTVRLSDIIDLGPMRNASTGSEEGDILLDAFSMLRMVLSPPSGVAIPMDLKLTVPGLTSTRLMIVTGPGEARSPMMTVTADKTMKIRTAQTRIYLDSTVATALPGIVSIHVPLYVELASADARLNDINCDTGAIDSGVGLSVTPSIGKAAIADIDSAALTNFAAPVQIRPAALAQVLVTKIIANASVDLGGVLPQAVHFNPAEIAAQQSKQVSTQDLTQGLAASLLSHAQVQVTVLGITINTGPLVSGVAPVLMAIAPLLDGILNSVTATLGVKLGTANVRVHQMRCGVPTLVG